MSDLHNLYQELIVDHNRRPRNRRILESPALQAEGYNPFCGDKITVFLKLGDDKVDEVTFEGSGCAISIASASLMTESLKGRTLADAKALFNKFRSLVTEEPCEGEGGPGLGKLEVFSGIHKYPARVKCATLAWHTAIAALDKCKEVVSTE